MNISDTSNYYKLWKNRGFPHFNSLGNQKLLVIPVTIKGYETRATSENKSIIEKAFFGSTSDTNYESLASYYKKSSYNKLNLSGEVTDWFELKMTPEEIGKASYKSDSVSTDYGTYTVLEKALAWVKETTTIDLTDYDNDIDGFVDEVYLVYSAPDYTEDANLAKLATAGSAYFWNFTFYDVKNKDSANSASPVGMTYSWGSLSSIFKGYGNEGIDSHNFIHEFGHQLGLGDYYNTNSGNAYISPMAAIDMMDYNIGDHSAYSKFSLGWVDPILVTGNSGDDVTINIKSFTEEGSFIILKDSSTTDYAFNNTPFDEYITLSLLTEDEGSVNYLDSVNGHVDPTKTDGSVIKYYQTAGIRMNHIDARGVKYESDSTKYIEFSDDINSMIATKFTNSPFVANGYYDKTTNNSYLLTTLLPKNFTHNPVGAIYVSDDTDLFKKGDEIAFTGNNGLNYSVGLPSASNTLDDGSPMNYKIAIQELSNAGAMVKISIK